MSILVIGGAGFIGANVAKRHLDRGERVVVFDNLSRRGSRQNLLWLEREGGERLRVVLGDASRDDAKLREEMAGADRIYHLAGQVAVTTSLLDPLADCESNLGSTVRILEAMRNRSPLATLIFSSTNKVYGTLHDVGTVLRQERWGYADGRDGIDETMPLDFHSPYGCSKGGADQYVRDYARVFGLKTIVLRQSCIYGPRQFGVEDQGWIVHFILAFALRRKIRIYGDGRQVRDALFIDDLIDVFDQVAARSTELKGEVFNVGGGHRNSLSILDLLVVLEEIFGYRPETEFGPWRQGDQRVFVSDNGKLARTFGWVPAVPLRAGLERTVGFVRENLELFSGALGPASSLL